jgi:hypothetical protein
MSRRRCCCNPPCDYCSSGRGPNQFEVVLDGFANGSCDCGNASPDGTYILDFGGDFACGWQYLLDSTDCGYTMIRLRVIDLMNGTYMVEVYVLGFVFGLGSGSNYFRKTYESKPDCSGFSSEDIPFSENTASYPCDASSATCLVTAL